jgi:tRNA/tmRNA/rRNA uracil-C5-methylase (TrmA/RlmC/RlmD family)
LLHPKKDVVFIHPTFGSWTAYNLTRGKKQYYPYPEGIFKIAEGPNERIVKKYTKKDFIEVSEGDTVVDIGAFVGEFTLGVADYAGKVVSCEPSPDTVSCLKKTQMIIDIQQWYQRLSGLVGDWRNSG